MKQYLNLMSDVLANGITKPSRPGIDTRSLFGRQLVFDLRCGFPIVTTKTVHFKSVVHELLWMIRGSTNVHALNKEGVTIWDEWRRPYTFDRPVVKIARIKNKTTPYAGDFSYAGVNAAVGGVEDRLASTWRKMMGRCYNPEAHNFTMYGAKGVTVDARWHDASVFIRDVQQLPHWRYKLKEWNTFELDKDYFDAGYYSPETCVWLHKAENVPCKPVGVRYPDGQEQWFVSQHHAAESVGVSVSSLNRFIVEGLPTILKGQNKKVAGWAFLTDAGEDFVVRRQLIPDGELGPVYGKQWRKWQGLDGLTVDQLARVQHDLRTDPYSRRHVVSAWNVSDLPDMALAPCHMLFQFDVREVNGKQRLSCMMVQRSADLFLGVPFNIASYALLTHMLAQATGMEVGDLIINFGDVHLYENHIEQAATQLTRSPAALLPKLVLNPDRLSVFDFTFDDIKLVGYEPQGVIKASVAV